MTEAPHRTAIARSVLSRPVWEYVSRGLLVESESVLDYGCGRGADVAILRLRGFRAEGYDPHPPFGFPRPSGPFDTVAATYVVNVIPTRAERAAMLADAWSLVRPGGRLLVASRSRRDVALAARRSRWTRHGDGWRPTPTTFQVGLGVADLAELGAELAPARVARLGFRTIDASGVALYKGT